MFEPISREELRGERLQAVMTDYTRPHEERIPALASAVFHLLADARANGGMLPAEQAGALRYCTRALRDYVDYEGAPSGDHHAREMALSHFAKLGMADQLVQPALSAHPEVREPARAEFLGLLDAIDGHSMHPEMKGHVIAVAGVLKAAVSGEQTEFRTELNNRLGLGEASAVLGSAGEKTVVESVPL